MDRNGPEHLIPFFFIFCSSIRVLGGPHTVLEGLEDIGPLPNDALVGACPLGWFPLLNLQVCHLQNKNVTL